MKRNRVVLGGDVPRSRMHAHMSAGNPLEYLDDGPGRHRTRARDQVGGREKAQELSLAKRAKQTGADM